MNADADIITSNTFRTNPSKLNDYNQKNPNSTLNSDDEVRAALSILHDLRKENSKPFFIAGSNPPSDFCYSKTQIHSDEIRKDNHANHINLLMKYGSDFIIHETFGFYNEVELCQKYCYQNNIENVVSLFVNNNLQMQSGENVLEILPKMDEYNPLAISFNCFDIDTFNKLMKEGESVIKSLKSGIGYYLNCGKQDTIENNHLNGIFTSFVSPQDYIEVVKMHNHLNPVMVGTCCMSNPEHTKAIYKYYYEK